MVVLTKSAGWTVIVALGLFWGGERLLGLTLHRLPIWRDPLVLVAAFSTVIVLLVDRVLFPTAAAEGYYQVWSEFEPVTVIGANLSYYWEFLKWFLFDAISQRLAGSVALAMYLMVALMGWLLQLRLRPGVFELWAGVYILMLLVYPYHASGVRFLLPVVPLFFLYAAMFLLRIGGRYGKAVVMLAAVPFVFTAQRSWELVQDWPTQVDGPQSEAAVALFHFVRTQTAPESTFVFRKPRVLVLYTDRRAMAIGHGQTRASILTQLDTTPVDHIILAEALPDPDMEALLHEQQNRTELVYDSLGFRVFRWEK